MKKAYRVKKNRDIEAIIHYRKVVRTTYFKVFKKPQTVVSHYRVAISVPKKFGNAVERNRIKRQVRAIVSNMVVSQGWDILIIVNKEAKGLAFSILEDQLTKSFKKQNLLEVKS